jgi:hypothetical protein
MNQKTFLLALVFVALAHAATVQVNVGDGGFSFSPSDPTINVGDTIEYAFLFCFLFPPLPYK